MTEQKTRLVEHLHESNLFEIQVYSETDNKWVNMHTAKSHADAIDWFNEVCNPNLLFPYDAICMQSGYARAKQSDVKVFRFMTYLDAKNLRTGSHIFVIDRNDQFRSVKITSIKTWKTRPFDIDVHYKYGLYVYGSVEYREFDRPEFLLMEEATY